MCFNTPKPPKIDPPAPPPPTPAPPPPPRPLPEPRDLELDGKNIDPKVQYGRKKSADVRARRGGTDSLKIPLNNPNPGGTTGGLNV